MNKIAHKDNKIGVKGLCVWVNHIGKAYWKCSVGLITNIIPFTESTKESQKEIAIAWLERTRTELHGEFVNHGTSHNS